ncbi:MAG: hypothetical protein K2X87_18390 [Gemmataceae bacterium]|nr:hypothetical protein [Gemmataceae bacterium]
MTTLEDAWAWYEAADAASARLAHLAKFWDDLPWGRGDEWVSALERDNVLRAVGGKAMEDGARTVRDELDDLAVLVLFSVFEATVRDQIATRIKPEADDLRDPTLRKAADDVLEAVTHGSFGRLLEPYKPAASGDLVERVNQVRRYRNWVAHGRRPDKLPKENVRPREAYERLAAFLAVFQEPVPVGQPTPPEATA